MAAIENVEETTLVSPLGMGAMSWRARPVEINKYRISKGLAPWRKLWSRDDKKAWAGSLEDEIDDEMQKSFLPSDADSSVMLATSVVFTADELGVTKTHP